MSSSDLLAADAVLGVVGSQTGASLMSGERSRKLDAGMGTLISMTKKEAAMAKRCKQSCKPTRTGNPRIRNKVSCKCLVPSGAAAKAKGICYPRKGSDGKMHDTVMVQGTYRTGARAGTQYTRCVKAGGQTAKEQLRGDACGTGKVLKKYTTKVPDVYGTPRADGSYRMRTVQASRCVKAVGAMKDCPANQVIVQAPQRGTLPDGTPYSTMAKRCVLPATAEKKGYRVLARGTLPVKQYINAVAMSVGSSAPKAKSFKAKSPKAPKAKSPKSRRR